ncbi:class I SAM-dependent methyltransferase [Candidatus Woesearchaeota archaeon]|nr:class I SAM-dependent methyltransferase [Candidatus Woesearchaeota archaeon]
MVSLGPFLLRRYSNRKKAIDGVFETAKNIIKTAKPDKETETDIMQAATAARYDVEIYKGTFVLSQDQLKFLARNFRNYNNIIVEGACATGEYLLKLADNLDSKLYLGLDISGAMVREAQQKAPDNVLFFQGDIKRLPIKENKAGIYVLNNVFDRVSNPRKASLEADRILSERDSFFVLSNCDPLQFYYKTETGLKIDFVSKKNQISLEEGLNIAGFRSCLSSEKGVWKIETIAYEKEKLPYKSLIGGR